MPFTSYKCPVFIGVPYMYSRRLVNLMPNNAKIFKQCSLLTRYDFFKVYNARKTLYRKLIQVACKPLTNLMFCKAFYSTQASCILNASFDLHILQTFIKLNALKEFALDANLTQTHRVQCLRIKIFAPWELFSHLVWLAMFCSISSSLRESVL